jgi:hypothetical protein
MHRSDIHPCQKPDAIGCIAVKTLVLAVGSVVSLSALAAHPLVTEDTGVQGYGNQQFELNTDRSVAHETKFSSLSVNATYTLGVSDTLDVAYNGPWLRNQVGNSPREFQRGLGDASIFMKWRAYEDGAFSVALKPIVYFPIGDHDKGLGADRVRAGVTGVTSWSGEGYNVLANLGYTDNNNKDGDRKSIWNTSAALVVGLSDKVRGAVEAGTYTNSDATSKKYPAFANLGLIYSPTEKFDLDVGYKQGLNDAEVKRSFGAGMTVRW